MFHFNMSDHSTLDDTVHSTETTFEKPKVKYVHNTWM